MFLLSQVVVEVHLDESTQDKSVEVVVLVVA
jgi:hypothetical protein